MVDGLMPWKPSDTMSLIIQFVELAAFEGGEEMAVCIAT
jgi:hypothetical protein